MNGFVLNSLRRAKVSTLRKIYMTVVAILNPNEVNRQWRKHCVKMQNALNEEHYFEKGWYMHQHELQDCR